MSTGEIFIREVPGGVAVKRTSQMTGDEHEMFMPVAAHRIKDWFGSDQLIQHVFPDLDDNQREFLLSGITPEEWEIAFPPEDE